MGKAGKKSREVVISKRAAQRLPRVCIGVDICASVSTLNCQCQKKEQAKNKFAGK